MTGEETSRTQQYIDRVAKLWAGDILELHFPTRLYKIKRKTYIADNHDTKQYHWEVQLTRLIPNTLELEFFTLSEEKLFEKEAVLTIYRRRY